MFKQSHTTAPAPHLPHRCATCVYYTALTISTGLCAPPICRGGEPLPVECRPNFAACHLYKKAPAQK